MPTIYDVAVRAGVSSATVSRVLNDNDTVHPDLAERVQKAVRELGYQRNVVARNLRLSRTKLWAAIISDIENPFFTALVRGIEDVAQSAGYSVVLRNSDENADKEAHYITAALAEQMAGVIISPSGRAEGIAQLARSGTPTVAIDREARSSAIDSVLVDNEGGAREATEHLLAAGYSRVGCITGPRRLYTASRRLRGYRNALRAKGFAYDKALVRYSDHREAGGYEAMRELLALDHPPDAVFVSNNLMTVGAAECLVDAGVPMPDRMGVVGFDDIPWAHLVRPSLTTIAQPTYELGRSAAQLLLDRISEPERPAGRVMLETVLHVRESSRPTWAID